MADQGLDHSAVCQVELGWDPHGPRKLQEQAREYRTQRWWMWFFFLQSSFKPPGTVVPSLWIQIFSALFLCPQVQRSLFSRTVMMRWMGLKMLNQRSVESTFPNVIQYRGSYRLRIYERENFGGQMSELMDDCDNVMDCYRMSNCMSCHVMDRHWLMYEQPHYRGRMMYMRPGEYRSFMNMGMGNMKFMSMKRIMDSHY
ncbi:gamma-crystallin M1-like [Seriola aureovittata]|uniref:gamma-crystallin M1-like n=1 Tax=Seriola aureovittata TaxID=2871759 RepID=UPI0024BEA48B|nr:gamma-crystallin M1-like [Seriola aureovittata]